MKIIKPSWAIEAPQPFSALAIMEKLERDLRTCYKSEDKIGPGSAEDLLRKIMTPDANGVRHEASIEHVSITVRFIVDRGVTHELVRHRMASYSQESTRFCNYGKAGKDKLGEVTFIRPCFWEGDSKEFACWRDAMASAEMTYLYLLKRGASPQQARSVLPNSLKTEIVMTANLREWRYVFKLRCGSRAHPQMRQVMIPLRDHLAELLPVIFGEEFRP